MLSEEVARSNNLKEKPFFPNKYLKILIIIILSIVFVLFVLLVLYITDIAFTKDNNVKTEKRENIVELVLPSDIYEAQVYKEYMVGDEMFLLYQRPNMNVDISESNDESGVLYAKEGDVVWKPFIKVRELGDSKNNVFFFGFDLELDRYVTLLIDANGAGSGEGIAKLVSIDDGWNLLNCFYYMPEDWVIKESLGIRDVVEEYIKNNPQYIQDLTDVNCTNFEIVLCKEQ